MGNKQSKKEKKRALREQQQAEERAAREAFEQRRRRYRIAAAVVPALTLAVALSIYLGMEDQQLAALVGMVGLAGWVPLVLGALGSEIQPRDRARAGSIDFGNKR